MRTVSHLVLVRAGESFFIHSTEGDDVPDVTIPVPEGLEEVAETIVTRSNATPGAVAAMETVVRLLERSVEAEDTPEGFELYMLADLDAALTKLRGL